MLVLCNFLKKWMVSSQGFLNSYNSINKTHYPAALLQCISGRAISIFHSFPLAKLLLKPKKVVIFLFCFILYKFYGYILYNNNLNRRLQIQSDSNV